MIFYGTSESPGNEDTPTKHSQTVVETDAHVAPLEEIANIMADETVQRNSIDIDENNDKRTEGKAIDDLEIDKEISNLISKWIKSEEDSKISQYSNNYNHYPSGSNYVSSSWGGSKRTNQHLNKYEDRRSRYNYGSSDSDNKLFKKSLFEDEKEITGDDLDILIQTIEEYLKD